MKIIKELPGNPRWLRRKETKYIVVHHAKATKCSIHDIDRWHKAQGWLGCGYHFLVRKDGSIYEGRPIDIEGAHTKGYNDMAIGICFEGDFDIEKPTDEQAKAGIELLRYLLSRYTGVKVMRHKDLNNTKCPGEHFPNYILMEGMKPMEKRHWADDIFKELNDIGIKIHEKRFDDKITRAEVFALIWQVVQWIKRK